MSLENIGNKLKSAREAQGLSLNHVYERTKIPLNHLEAIDTGNGEDLPEPVYVSGFIRRYAECVGLDGQILGDEYRRHIDESAGRRNGRKEQVPVYATPDYVSRSKIKVAAPTFKTVWFNLLIVFGLVGLLSWFFSLYTNNAINSMDPSLLSLKESTSRLSPAPVTSPTAQPALTPVAPAPTSQKLTLLANKHVWIDVKRLSTGESIYQGNLEANDRRDFEDAVGLSVRAGDGASLSIEKDGKVELFGAAGKPQDRTFQLPQAAGAVTAAVDRPATTGVAGAAAIVRQPRRIVKRTPSSESAPSRHSEGGYRSIGGDGGGARSIDVPYRYNEGRLDSD